MLQSWEFWIFGRQKTTIGGLFLDMGDMSQLV